LAGAETRKTNLGLFGSMANWLKGVQTTVQAKQQTEAAEEREVLAELAAQLNEARREWQAARAYFETVTDPELVDQAVHLVLATEKRYEYLLRQMKETYSRLRQA